MHSQDVNGHSRARGRRLDTATRRAQLVDAVREVIRARGVRGLSVGAVARRVGLTPSAIYRHYPSKEALLDAVVERIGERLRANVEAVQAEPGALARLEALLARHVELIRENEALPRLLFSEDFYAGHPERRRRVMAVLMGFAASVTAIVREGQRRGEIRAGLDPRTAAILFIGLFQPAALLWSLSAGAFDLRRQARGAWPLFRAAIAASPSRSGRSAPRGARRRSLTMENRP